MCLNWKAQISCKIKFKSSSQDNPGHCRHPTHSQSCVSRYDHAFCAKLVPGSLLLDQHVGGTQSNYILWAFWHAQRKNIVRFIDTRPHVMLSWLTCVGHGDLCAVVPSNIKRLGVSLLLHQQAAVTRNPLPPTPCVLHNIPSLSLLCFDLPAFGNLPSSPSNVLE